MQLSPGAVPVPRSDHPAELLPLPSCELVTGSGALLPPSLAGIVTIVDLPVRIGEQEVDARNELELHRFYARLRDGEMAETSTSPPGAFLEAFRRSTAPHILCLTIPARWSGMDDSARLAARMLTAEEGLERVTVIDTGTAAAGLGLITRVAAGRAVEGASASEVIERARRAINEVRMFGALETLEFVARSGRINGLIAGISDSLHVRPVFRLSNGQTGRVALARTRSGVLSALEKTARELPERLWILVFHAEAPELAAELEAGLRRVCDVARCETVALDPIIGTHTGPGVVGYAALPLLDGEFEVDINGAVGVEPKR
ncbi:MAG: DegV family protein [Candidatus Dormiibacterota bacterium]